MDFIKEKIRVMSAKLSSLIVTDSTTVEYSFIECPQYKVTNTPPAEDAGWQPRIPGMQFSGVDSHYWLHMKLHTPPSQPGKDLRLTVSTGKEGPDHPMIMGGWDAMNPQFTVYVNGVTTQALDTNHTWLPLDGDQDYEIYMYLYNGMLEGSYVVNISLNTVDLEIEGLYYDVNVPYLCLLEMEEASYDYIQIRNALDKALLRLDLRHVYSDDFYKGILSAREYLKTEFYEKICGHSDYVLSAVGHTHIDVAWLWSVAQTREKAQRSFSTVLNLMKRYDEYIFMSSQPQLYQHVKESDPELYARIKKAIKDGKWEAEGAMWLEADTVLTGGEYLIRQILYGKRFMKEEFGVENKILWLPDVFGYSGALPQIMQKSGITQLFAAKLNMSDTNPMPHDTFIWEGIDGSKVFASMISGYAVDLNPRNVCTKWRQYKDKTFSNNNLITFGFGDGGGGPTYEMLENYRRFQYGIPGMPRLKLEKGGDFLDRQEEVFQKNTAELRKTPKWVGEMYFERHRGTYTSIAKNKKNNRKSELLYQMAENAAVMDMVLNGGSYPTDTIHRNMLNILLNQFHDILPGSAIKEVYDVTDAEYERILREGQEIFAGKLQNIKANLKTPEGIFVWNPTPFEISDYIQLDGKTYYAENVPARGWKVIPDNAADSGITVTDHQLENDLVRVTFNHKYHIVSVYDKEEQREIIPEGAEANRFEVFEDYPKDFDAWEISSYYQQKMWVADDVQSVTLLPCGLRIVRNYQHSTITQDILLRKGSKRIDFETTVDWQEEHVLLKAAFPVDIHSSTATCEVQFGNVERPTHRNTSWEEAKFEVFAHKWADLSEGGYGVSILNDCKYGYSVEDNIMKLSLLRASTYPYAEADRGMHQFTYSLYPHTGDYRTGQTVQEAYLLNMPLQAEAVPATDGILPNCYSLFSCDKENIVIETIKKAEDDDSVIVRLYEAYNSKTNVTLTHNFDFREVYLCDMMENNLQKLDVTGYTSSGITIPVKNFEIVTLKFVR